MSAVFFRIEVVSSLEASSEDIPLTPSGCCIVEVPIENGPTSGSRKWRWPVAAAYAALEQQHIRMKYAAGRGQKYRSCIAPSQLYRCLHVLSHILKSSFYICCRTLLHHCSTRDCNSLNSSISLGISNWLGLYRQRHIREQFWWTYLVLLHRRLEWN